MARFVTHLESALDGTQYPADEVQTMHENRPLWVRYDLDAVKASLSKSDLLERPAEMWRYRELLPVGDEIKPVTLIEPMSPIVDCPRLAAEFGLQHVSIKDESRSPTNSFKCRGLSMACTFARHFGATRVAMASNGNAGGALGLYAARAGMESVVFMPAETMSTNLIECHFSGTQVYRANGLIDECGKAIRHGHDQGYWFDVSTMKEPYRLEGKKTMGLELAEQFNWDLPDVILYPTGGGTALIAMWKAFDELEQMGWLETDRRPRMISVQSDGCQPLVDAFNAGERFSQRAVNAATMASGLRVPISIGDFMVIDTVKASGGKVMSAAESRIEEWQQLTTRLDGVFICPETAVCIGALEQLVRDGEIHPDERVVIFNTAAGQKYVERNTLDIPSVDLKAVDWDSFAP